MKVYSYDYCVAQGLTYLWTLSTGLSLAESCTFLPEVSSGTDAARLSANQTLLRHVTNLRLELETELTQLMQNQDPKALHMVMFKKRKDCGLEILHHLEEITEGIVV